MEFVLHFFISSFVPVSVSVFMVFIIRFFCGFVNAGIKIFSTPLARQVNEPPPVLLIVNRLNLAISRQNIKKGKKGDSQECR